MNYLKYEKYVDSEVEWIGEVPENWKVKRLKYTGIIKYGLGQPPEEKEDGLPIIRATNVERGKINKKNLLFVDPDDVPFHRDPVLRKNDIIVVRSGAYTADSAIIPEEFDGAITGYDMVYRAVSVNPKFLSFAFLSRYILQNQLLQYAVRAAQPHLNREELGNTIIILPPIHEQQAIANFLDKEVARIDTLIQKKQQFIERLKEKRLAVISRAVTRGIDPEAELKSSGVEWLGDIPKEWEVKKLKYVVDLINLKIEINEDNPLPYIGLENIVPWKGKLIENEENYIPDSLSNYYFKNCVLFGKLRPYLAKACITESEGLCSSELLVLRPSQTINKFFLKYCILSDGFIKNVNSSTFGSKMPRASWDHVGNIKMPVLNIEEQGQIVHYIDKEISKIDSILIKTEAAIFKLQEYKTALISAAVTGKIKVTEEI